MIHDDDDGNCDDVDDLTVTRIRIFFSIHETI